MNLPIGHSVKRCGNCKWLTGGVEPRHRKKDGEMKHRYNFSMFSCTVPFDPPTKTPACFEIKLHERRMMAPYYGDGCPFHENVSVIDREVSDG